MRKTLIALLLATLLAFAACALAEAPSERLGNPMPDFSVETIEGGTFTLSDALERSDMVLVNLWATWCPPCEMEFPALEAAYEQYADRVSVIALSVEPGDTPDVLLSYAADHGLTFSIGSDLRTNLASMFVTVGIPTTVVVDRFGNIAMIEVGAQLQSERFTALFDYFLDEGYTRTAPVDGFPDPLPASGEGASPERPDAYIVEVVDQNGDPVPGVYVNFCTDDTCTPARSDENGVIVFEGEPYLYHLQILKVPEGYSFDPDFEAYTDVAYDSMTLEIAKD